MDWKPQAPLTAFQACRKRFFVLKNNIPFLDKVLFRHFLTFVVNIWLTFTSDFVIFVNIDQYTVPRTAPTVYQVVFQVCLGPGALHR